MPEGVTSHPGHQAMKHFARVLEQKPHKDDHELSRLTNCLSAFRDELIEAQRAPAVTANDRVRLSHLNAIISVVMGMHFPLDSPPWEEFGKAQAWLVALVAEIERD